ncbi:MAG: hypothetical protein KDB14_12540 [Planctomycetales bacterium]|nr:hypothetical protein [Planctomycetales bacterium]
MANIQDKVGEQQQPTGGGMRRVVADSSHSLAELRDFMGRLKGKSPQEVLGEVATSGLVRSTTVAAIGFLVVILSLSVGAHYWKQAFPKSSGATAATSSKKTDDDQPGNTAANESAATTPSGGAASPATPAEPATKLSGDPTLDNLGIGETKDADPKKNPLESTLDNLLDDTK